MYRTVLGEGEGDEPDGMRRPLCVGVVPSEEERDRVAGEVEYRGMRKCPRTSSALSVPFVGVSIGLDATELESSFTVDWL